MKYWILDKDNNLDAVCNTLSEARELFKIYNDKYYRIEKSRVFYEVAAMKRVKGSVGNDFETVEFIFDGTYRECVKAAKEESIKHDACQVVCYTWTEESLYEYVFTELYIKGKKQRRYTV